MLKRLVVSVPQQFELNLEYSCFQLNTVVFINRCTLDLLRLEDIGVRLRLVLD